MKLKYIDIRNRGHECTGGTKGALLWTLHTQSPDCDQLLGWLTAALHCKYTTVYICSTVTMVAKLPALAKQVTNEISPGEGLP